MRLLIRRRGGIAGVTLRAEVDTADLPAEEAASLEAAVRDLAERSPATAQPDAFRYEITPLEDPGSRPVLVDQRDLSPDLRRLIDRVAKSGEIERR